MVINAIERKVLVVVDDDQKKKSYVLGKWIIFT